MSDETPPKRPRIPFFGDGFTKPTSLAASRQTRSSWENGCGAFFDIHSAKEDPASLLKSLTDPDVLHYLGTQHFVPHRIESMWLLGSMPPGEYSRRAPVVDLLHTLDVVAPDIETTTWSRVEADPDADEEPETSPGSSCGTSAQMERTYERQQAVDFSVRTKQKLLPRKMIEKLLFESKRSVKEALLLDGFQNEDTFQLAHYGMDSLIQNWLHAKYLGQLRLILIDNSKWGLIELEPHGVIEMRKGKIVQKSVEDAQADFVARQPEERRRAAAYAAAAAARAAAAAPAAAAPPTTAATPFAVSAAAAAGSPFTDADAASVPAKSELLDWDRLETKPRDAETGLTRLGKLPVAMAQLDDGYYMAGRMFVQDEVSQGVELRANQYLTPENMLLLEVTARAVAGDRMLRLTLEDAKRLSAVHKAKIAEAVAANTARQATIVRDFRDTFQ